MIFIQHYDSPMGGILLAADEVGLTGLWFDGQKYFARDLPAERIERNTPALSETGRWLDIYFTGKEPDFMPPLHPIGSAFRQSVWKILLQIPYGQTTTYGEIARQLAEKQGRSKMSAQAVGGAVGHNEISILIPCHRVVGTSGSLTGYAGGIDKKIRLLELEHADMHRFFIPRKGTLSETLSTSTAKRCSRFRPLKMAVFYGQFFLNTKTGAVISIRTANSSSGNSFRLLKISDVYTVFS